jgi:hypothetical protein
MAAKIEFPVKPETFVLRIAVGSTSRGKKMFDPDGINCDQKKAIPITGMTL